MKVFGYILKSQRTKELADLDPRLLELLDFKPKNPFVFEKALTHSSCNRKDADGNLINYERLEFLGDALLGMIISEQLFDYFPKANEGELTKLRSKIVSRESLNSIGKKFELLQMANAVFDKNKFGENIHGNLLEALVGAIFVDQGFKQCKAFVLDKIVALNFDLDTLDGVILSYKGALIEWAQKNKHRIKFQTDTDMGLDRGINYYSKIILNHKVVVKAREISKKKAEEKAARRAVYALKLTVEELTNP
ncbi:MAG: ribonuclease III [Flavobacteriaceae bacterium]